MIERFHGIDRHKAMIYGDTSRSSERLTRLVLEASCGAFWWADRIEEQSAQCHVLNPHRFRIIKDSWNKTDRQDARNMAKALWVYLVTDEFGIPTVHKPTLVVRELRKLFSGYDLINRQLRTLKNSIQAALVDEGVVLSSRGKSVYGHRREPFGVRGCLSYDKENSWDYEDLAKPWSVDNKIADVRATSRVGNSAFSDASVRSCEALQIGENPQTMRRPLPCADRAVPISCRRSAWVILDVGGTRSGSVHQALQLVHGQRQDAEHQAQHLGVTAHAYLTGAEFVLEPAVDALHGRARGSAAAWRIRARGCVGLRLRGPV